MGTRTRMVYTMINTAPVVQQRHRAHAASVRVGGMRRKVKRVPNNSSYDDKRLQLALQKLALQKISEVQEASLTKSDGAVVRLTVADVSVSVSSNTCVINTKAVNVQPEAEAPTAATPEDEVTEVVAEEATRRTLPRRRPPFRTMSSSPQPTQRLQQLTSTSPTRLRRRSGSSSPATD